MEILEQHYPSRERQTKIISLAILAALTGLVMGATTFARHQQQNESTRTEMLQHLQAVGHNCFLLRNLPPGQGDDVRAMLSGELRGEIASLQSLPVNDPGDRRFIENICGFVFRDVRRNPRRYLCVSPGLRASERAAREALQASGSTQFVAVPASSDNKAENN